MAINRRDAIEPALDVLIGIADEVLAIDLADVQRARRLLGDQRLSARDAIHVAAMHRHDVARILSFDRAFDAVPGIERIH